MTFFPKTLSTSIRQELGPESLYPSYTSLLDKLNSNHRILLIFFRQATQSDQWCNQHWSLLRGLFVVITAKSITSLMPIEPVMSACIYLMRFNERALRQLYDFDFILKLGDSQFKICRLFFMTGSDVLKKWFLDRPLCKEIELKVFAPYLTDLNELQIIYRAVAFNMTSYIHFAMDTTSIMRLILQCQTWKLQKIQIALEKLLCNYIKNYITAMDVFGFAVFFKLNILREYCEGLLNADLYFSKDANGPERYSYIRVNYQANENILKTISFAEYQNKFGQEFQNVFSDRIDIIFIENKTAVVSLCKLTTDELSRANSELQVAEKGKLPRDKIDKLILDGTNPVPNNFLLGMLYYFNSIYSLNLTRYHFLETDTLSQMGQVKPNLSSLTFTNCSQLSDSLLRSIPAIFPNLQVLNIHKAFIYKKACEAILNMPSLTEISFAHCSVELPDPVNFSKLRKFVWVNSSYHLNKIDGEFIQNIFVNGVNIVSLIALNMKLFELNQYPHPDKLQELMIDCDELEKNINKNKTLPLLDNFKNLKFLWVVGNTSQTLKQALIEYKNRIEISYF